MTDDEWDALIDDQLKGKLPESTPEYIRRLIQEKKADADALDFIASVMSGTEWSADTLDIVAEVVRGTGREIKDLLDDCAECGHSGGEHRMYCPAAEVIRS